MSDINQIGLVLYKEILFLSIFPGQRLSINTPVALAFNNNDIRVISWCRVFLTVLLIEATTRIEGAHSDVSTIFWGTTVVTASASVESIAKDNKIVRYLGIPLIPYLVTNDAVVHEEQSERNTQVTQVSCYCIIKVY